MAQYTPGGGGLSIIATYTVMGITTTILFALRVYVRVNLVKRSWEDWAAAIGWLFFMSICCLAVVGSYHGFGQHVDLIPPSILPIGLKIWWFQEPLYAISNMALKLSIALMLLRIVVEEYHKKIIYIVTGVVEAYSVIFFLGFMIQCVPASFFWTRFQGNTHGHCLDPKIIVVATYIYSLITVVYDWTMALLPWFIVRKLRLDFRTRLMVAVVLALASIASIATIVRIPYIAALTHTEDFLYSNTGLGVWSGVETGLSITASNAAILGPLFRKPSVSDVRHPTPILATIPSTSDGSSSIPKSPQHDTRVSDQDVELGLVNGRWHQD